MVVVADQHFRLKGVDQCILFGELPVERHTVLVVIPVAVKPDRADLAVIGQKLR